MASEIRVNQIQNRSGLSTVTFSDTGVVISGITTISDLRTSGNTIVAAGTTSAPSISPTGDSNTGIFFPAPDTVAIAEGGVEALRIDSSARIGIGTNNPGNSYSANGTEKLQVVGGNVRLNPGLKTNTNVPLILSTMESSNNMELIFIQEKTSYHSIESVHQGVTYTPLSFQPNGGSIGIGITNPGAKLHVSGGNIKVDSGYGIDFSATANSSGTMTSELLSDYEEGTWTPVMLGTSVAGSWSGNSANGGFYIKVGKQVTAWANVNGTLSGASGSARVSGIPFNRSPNSTPSGSGNSMYSTGAIQYWSGISVQAMGPLIEPSNLLYFHTYTTNSTSGADVPATNASHNLHFFITYFTA